MRKLPWRKWGRNPRTPRWGRPAAHVPATVLASSAGVRLRSREILGEVLEVGGRWGGLNFRTTEWVVVRLRKIESGSPPPSRGGPATGAELPGPCSPPPALSPPPLTSRVATELG